MTTERSLQKSLLPLAFHYILVYKLQPHIKYAVTFLNHLVYTDSQHAQFAPLQGCVVVVVVWKEAEEPLRICAE